MNLLITILDIVCSINILVTLNLVQKYNRAWLAYAFGNFLFVPLTLYKGLPGLAIMGTILFLTGLNNYRKGRREQK